MASNNRPPFWLKVRKDYIFDNFENILVYLRQYVYDKREENPDYDDTLSNMVALSEDIGSIIRNTPFYRPLELPYPISDCIRLFCATILGGNKAERTHIPVILSLVTLLTRQHYNMAEETLNSFYNIVLNCIRGREMAIAGFAWSDIEGDKCDISMLPFKVARMKFRDESGEPVCRYIENKGLLVIPPAGIPDISIVNRLNYVRGQYDVQYTLPEVARVLVPRGEYDRIIDFDRAYQLSTRLLSAQNQFRPSPRITLLDYSYDDIFVVRVTAKSGRRVIAETIDPKYRRLSGKILLNLPVRRCDANRLSDLVEEGDLLMVMRSREEDFVFETEDTFEDFYREYASEYAAQTRYAIYTNRYSAGTEWITEDGIRVGVASSKYEHLSDEEKSIFDEAVEDGFPIIVKLYDNPPDIDAADFNVYAEPRDLYNAIPEDIDFTMADAESEIVHIFLEYCREEGEKIQEGSTDEFAPADVEICRSLIPVMHRMISDGLSSSHSRLEFITTLAMICKICGCEEEFTYMDHERRFLYSEIQFAANRELSPLTHPATIADVEEVARREEIVNTLMGYRKKKVTRSATNLSPASDTDSLEKIKALVTASNNLIDIIDNMELNNIKQVIARALSIDDEYVSILDDRTFYGMESISLEFKTSVVFPPSNQRRLNNVVADPDTQRWAIIKAVCGFLNSRSGGDLLIGVGDNGYARGLDDDIKALYARRDIAAPDIDHYRTYLQKMFDRAFAEINGDANSYDIAKLYIDFIPETNAEGKTIIRVKVKPYPDKLIRLATPAIERPKGIEDSYVRQSGRTVCITPAMQEEILRYKTGQ